MDINSASSGDHTNQMRKREISAQCCSHIPRLTHFLCGLGSVIALALLLALGMSDWFNIASADEKDREFVALFPQDGSPADWTVREWNEVSKQAPSGTKWMVKDGVLHGSSPRGTWLMSNKEYGNFELTFEFKLGERGNSGCALRAPMYGDPAFDGLELQMADLRYNPEAKDSELTGGIYRAIAPKVQVYKPTEWNRYEILLTEKRIKISLNGEIIHDFDLFEQMQEVRRHDGTLAPSVKDRTRRGHIGFQELSRDGDHVQIRNARIKVLD